MASDTHTKSLLERQCGQVDAKAALDDDDGMVDACPQDLDTGERAEQDLLLVRILRAEGHQKSARGVGTGCGGYHALREPR